MIRTCKFCRRTADTESVNCPYCNSAYSVDNTMQGQAQPQYQQPVQQPQYVQPEYQQPGFQQPVQQPQYQQPYVMPTYDAPSATGTGALVCGIIALILAFLGTVLSVVGVILGIVAIVMGVKAKKNGGKGKATAGIITGIIAIIMAIIKILLVVLVLKVASDAVNPALERASKGAAASSASMALDGALLSYAADSEQKYALDENGNGEYCVRVSSLIRDGYMSSKGDIEGSVLITIQDNKATYKVWLKSGKYYINGETTPVIDKVTDKEIPSSKLNSCNNTGILK